MKLRKPEPVPSIDAVAFAIAFLLLGLVLQGTSLGPGGDSWSFAWTVSQLVDHGRFALSEAQGMTLFGQTLLAAPVAWLFSAEPVVLNRFTLVLSAATLAVFLLVLRRLGAGRGVSLLAAATLGVNPLWLSQSMSFETEIPFLFYSWLGVLALVEWDRTRRLPLLWCAGLAFAGAAAVRQHAIVFAGAGLLYALRTTAGRPATWLPWLLPPLVVAAFYWFIHATDRVPTAFVWQQTILRLHWSDRDALLWTTFIGVFAAVVYFGQFLLPLSVIRARRPRSPSGTLAACTVTVLLAAAAVKLWWSSSRTMPYVAGVSDPSAILRSLGLGALPPTARILWTAFAVVCAVFAYVALRTPRHERERGSATDAVWDFLTMSGCLLLAVSLTVGMSFDRYLLLPLPFLIPAFVRGVGAVQGTRLLLSAGILSVALAGSSVLVDQRVRFSECGWAAAHELMRSGIDARRINGGIAFNGYYSLEHLMRGTRKQRFAALTPIVHPDAEFLVTSVAQDGPGRTRLDSLTCPNLPGFRAIEFFTYQCEPRKPPAAATLCQPVAGQGVLAGKP